MHTSWMPDDYSTPRPPEGTACIGQFENLFTATVCRDTLIGEGFSVSLEQGASFLGMGQVFVLWAPEEEAVAAAARIQELLTDAGEMTDEDIGEDRAEAALCDTWEDVLYLRTQLRRAGIAAEIDDSEDAADSFALMVAAETLPAARQVIEDALAQGLPDPEPSAPEGEGEAGDIPPEVIPSCPNCQGNRVIALSDISRKTFPGILDILSFCLSVLVPTRLEGRKNRWYCPDCGWEW